MDPVHTHEELPETALAPMPKTRSAVASSVALIRNPPGQHIHSDPRVQAFANAVMAATGADSFGTYLGHDSPTPELCLDVFVPKTPRTLADAVAQFVMDHYDEYGLWYVIRRQQIWNPQVANYWRDMEDRGDDTANHFDHDHVSFMETGPAIPAPAPIPTPMPTIEEASSMIVQLVYIPPNGKNGEDWLFDGPAQIMTRISAPIWDVLKACNVPRVVVEKEVLEFFQNIAKNAAFTG